MWGRKKQPVAPTSDARAPANALTGGDRAHPTAASSPQSPAPTSDNTGPGPGTQRDQRHYGVVLLIAVSAVWLASLVVLGWWGQSRLSSREPDLDGGTPAATPTAGADQAVPQVPTGAGTANVPCEPDPVRVTPETPARLALRGAAVVAVNFGRGANAQSRLIEYEIDDPEDVLTGAACIEVQIGPFIRDTGSGQLDPSSITTRETVRGNRLAVEVTFDRTDAGLGLAGSYTGVVSVVDPRVQRVDTPMTVTMAFPVWQLPIGLLISVTLPAMAYVFLLKGSFRGEAPENEDPAFERFGEYLAGRNGWLAFITGTTATVGVFSTTYLSSATWAWEGQEIAALGMAMFGAFVTGATAVTAAGADRGTNGLPRSSGDEGGG